MLANSSLGLWLRSRLEYDLGYILGCDDEFDLTNDWTVMVGFAWRSFRGFQVFFFRWFICWNGSCLEASNIVFCFHTSK